VTVTPIAGVPYWYSETARAFTAPGRPSFLLAQPTVGLVHPGVVYSQAQIDFVSAKVKAGTTPWAGQMTNLKGRTAGYGFNDGKAFSDLTWTPQPVANVGRGSSGTPDQGGWDFLMDCTAAAVHAMCWAYTGDRARASKAASILNAWGAVMQSILFDTTTWSDGKLLAGWTGSIIGRAVELLRYTGYNPTGAETVPNWTNIDRMLRNAILPMATVWHSGSGGNWIASFTDATIQLGVALDDQATFQLGVDRWRRVVPSLFWLNSDATKNPYPNLAGLPFVPPWTMWDNSTTTAATIRSIWGNPTSWPDGLEFENFRDMHHSAMSFAAVANGAETAYHQGVNLYGEEQTRIVAACELFTRWVYEWAIGGAARPVGWPFTHDVVGYTTSTQRATWEILYNHYAGRLGVSMPMTLRLLTSYTRPNNFDVDLHNIADQLTHQGTYAVS
jgi:hypothetical protein